MVKNMLLNSTEKKKNLKLSSTAVSNRHFLTSLHSTQLGTADSLSSSTSNSEYGFFSDSCFFLCVPAGNIDNCIYKKCNSEKNGSGHFVITETFSDS